MKFFFPDSQDQVDPNFNFDTEDHLIHRIRQRDDRYAHEVLSRSPYDGILISKTMVDGINNKSGKYSVAQRNRFYRVGANNFFRTNRSDGPDLLTMGDCGAFTYVSEDKPPYTVDQLIDFYDSCKFQFGLSLDHAILGYKGRDGDQCYDSAPKEWRERQQLTVELASEFYRRHSERHCTFTPIGVAQGWSPGSYRSSVESLQEIGYSRVALGGMVPLKTPEIIECLAEISKIISPETQIHLLGVTRVDSVKIFAGYQVTSFDSTSPFRQAFKDERDNYWTLDGKYSAIKIPQVDGNPTMRKLVASGEINQDRAFRLEALAITAVRDYAGKKTSIEGALDALLEYEALFNPKRNLESSYRRTLSERPWEKCDCSICQLLGIEVILFRGSERNKRRGFHNLEVFRKMLDSNKQIGAEQIDFDE